MRFLGIGDAADLAALYLRLAAEGHQVKVYIGNPFCRGTLAGLVSQVADWQPELQWVREAGPTGAFSSRMSARGGERFRIV